MNFLINLKKPSGYFALIAEIKLKSPSEGFLGNESQVVEINEFRKNEQFKQLEVRDNLAKSFSCSLNSTRVLGSTLISLCFARIL